MNRTSQLQLFAAGLTLVLWAVPFAGLVLMPLEYLNTHIHEFCHALTVVATGGEPAFIHVYGGGGGLTPFVGGNVFLAASSGYVGAAFIGGLVILFSRTEKGARISLILLGVTLALSMLLWVRGDIIGVLSGILWTLLLFAAAFKLKSDNLIFAAQFLGIHQCLRAAVSLYVLLNINAFTGIENDAALAEQVTGIPRLLWALIWCGISVAWMAVALRPSFRQGRSTD